jgi:hypothetical protein
MLSAEFNKKKNEKSRNFPFLKMGSGRKKLKKAMAKLEKDRLQELQVFVCFFLFLPSIGYCSKRIAAASLEEYESKVALKKEEKALKKERKKQAKAQIETSRVVFLSKKRTQKPWFVSVAAVESEPQPLPVVPTVVVVESKREKVVVSQPVMRLSLFSKDLLVLILKMLPLESVRALACANKFFCEFILRSESGKLVWKEMCARMFGVTTCMLESWKYT